jgi:hypothetical protein
MIETIAPVRALKRAKDFCGVLLIPGLRSLRSHKHPTRAARVGTPLRGYCHAAAPRLVEP